MSKHYARFGRPTVASIRRRLVLERNLPVGVTPTPENMLRYYGITVHDADAVLGEVRRQAQRRGKP